MSLFGRYGMVVSSPIDPTTSVLIVDESVVLTVGMVWLSHHSSTPRPLSHRPSLVSTTCPTFFFQVTLLIVDESVVLTRRSVWYGCLITHRPHDLGLIDCQWSQRRVHRPTVGLLGLTDRRPSRSHRPSTFSVSPTVCHLGGLTDRRSHYKPPDTVGLSSVSPTVGLSSVSRSLVGLTAWRAPPARLQRERTASAGDCWSTVRRATHFTVCSIEWSR